MTEFDRQIAGNRKRRDTDGFSLTLAGDYGVLGAGPWAIGDLLTVERIELLLSDISFPFDLPSGIAGLRNRRLLLGRLDLVVYVDALESELRKRLARHERIRLWGLSFEADFVQVFAVCDEVPVSIRLAPVDARGGLGFLIENAVAFGPLEGNLLAAAADAIGALAGVRPAGLEVGTTDFLWEVLFQMMPRRGWRIPDASEVRLFHRRLHPDRMTLSFVHPTLLPPEGSDLEDDAVTMDHLLLQEERRVTADGDRFVTEQQADRARAFYARLLDRDPDSPFAAARLGMLDVVVADRRAEALQLLEATRKVHPGRLDLIAPMLQAAALMHDTPREIALLHEISELGAGLERLGASIRLGELYIDTEPRKAVAALEQALSTRRGDTRTLLALINAEAKLGDTERVSKLIPRWLAAHPQGAPRTAAHVIAGEVLLSLSSPSEAMVHFVRAEMAEPANRDALRGMARAAEMLGDKEREIRVLDRLERICREVDDPLGAAEALARLADIWAEKGEIPLALQRLGTALDLAPGDAARRLTYARLLVQSDRPAEAAAVFEAVLKSHESGSPAPWYADAAVRLARLYLDDLADPSSARFWARRCVPVSEQRDAARSILRRGIAAQGLLGDPAAESLSPIQVRLLAGDLQLLGEDEGVLEALEKGAASFPNAPALLEDLIAEYRRLGRHTQLRKALADRIEMSSSPKERAAMALELGDLDLGRFDAPASAVCWYRTALEAAPSEAAKQGLEAAFRALNEQAAILMEQGDFEAADTLLDVIREDSDDPDPMLARLEEAEVAYGAGAYQEALDIADTLLKARREIRKRAALVAARVLRRLGRETEAVSLLEEISGTLMAEDAVSLLLYAIDIAPKEIVDREKVLATLRLNRGGGAARPNLDQAIATLLAVTGEKRALAEHLLSGEEGGTVSPDRRRRAASLLCDAGDTARATAVLEALYRETGSVSDLFLLAETMKKQGRTDQLIALLEEKRGLDPKIDQLLRQELVAYSALLKQQSLLGDLPASDQEGGEPDRDSAAAPGGLGPGGSGLLDSGDDGDLDARLTAAFDSARKKDEA